MKTHSISRFHCKKAILAPSVQYAASNYIGCASQLGMYEYVMQEYFHF